MESRTPEPARPKTGATADAPISLPGAEAGATENSVEPVMGWPEWLMVAFMVLWPLEFLGICSGLNRLEFGEWR